MTYDGSIVWFYGIIYDDTSINILLNSQLPFLTLLYWHFNWYLRLFLLLATVAANGYQSNQDYQQTSSSADEIPFVFLHEL